MTTTVQTTGHRRTGLRAYLQWLAVLMLCVVCPGSVWAQYPTDVTGYETVTVTISATGYDEDAGGAGLGAPQMASVKYNKTFPLVLTSDDMGKTELTNNWASLNGYPNINGDIDLGIQPGGTKFLQLPYKKYYTQAQSQDVDDHQPMTYTDNVGKTQRYRMTCAVMPYDINSGNYAKITANDAKLMLRTGFSFAQHDVDDISSVSAISSAMTTNNTTWTNAVGIGLKVMVEPNGNHNYLTAGVQNSGICWNIFQNPTSEYPGNSKALSAWTNSRTDWSASGIDDMPSTFSSKPTGGYTRIFFQGNESAWKTAVDAADGSNIIIGGTHGLGDDIKSHLRTSSNVTDNAWVCGADEAWEYYHIYNNLKIENVTFGGGTLSFDVLMPTYNKNQFRELTLNIPGLTGGGAPTFSTASGKTVPVTGGYQQTSTSGIGYTMNFGLESSITTYIDQLMTIYRDDQTNAYVKRDLEYLISQLWDGASYTSQLNANPTYDRTVLSSLGTTLATIKTDTNGDKSFAVPRYIVSGSTLYEHTANAVTPYYVNTIATNSAPSAVSYAAKTVSGDAVLFVEGEDMTGATVVGADFDNTNTSDSRYYAMRLASMGMGGCIVSGTPATVTSSLPRGTYKMVIGYGNSSTGDTNYSVCVGGSSVYAFSTSTATGQTVTEFTTDDFDIEVDNTPVTITSDYTNDHPEKGNRWIDYVYIIKTADLAAAQPTMTFTKSTAAATVKTGTTATLTATAVPNGGSGLTTSIYAADSESNIVGGALATGSTDVSYDFTPSLDGTYYFVAQSTNSTGTTTSALITLTATSITNYTLNIVDKSGNTAMSTTIANPGSPAQTDPLPDAYRSPFAENYHYYLSATDAQNNNTANALANTDAWSNATIYVGYDVKSTFGSDKKFAVWANSRYMHMVYRVNQAHSSNDYYMTNQKYDISDIPSDASSELANHEITTSNYTLLDNHFMWDLGDDPYNVVFKNVANQRYLKTQYNNSASVQTDISNGNHYCIIYWQAKANNSSIETGADYYRLYDRTLSTNSTLAYDDTGNRFLSCSNDNNCEWRTIDRKHGSYDTFTKIYIKALPEVTVNVLDSHGAVEAQLQAYNNTAATMQSFTPYSMLRAYTSGQTLYYDAAHTDAVTASAVLSTSKLEANGSNLYMTYDLVNAKWRTVVKDAVTYYIYSYEAEYDDDANWYGLRYNNGSNYIMASALSSNLGNTSLANITGTNADTDNGKKGQWVLIGTPYHLELANRYLGIDNLLGIPSDATTSSKAQVRAAGTSDVITTWEVVTWLNQGKSHLFFRPQGGFNAQAPNLFLSTTGGLAGKPGGGEMWDFYWAAETTEHYAPAATLTISPTSADAYVDEATALTATATPAEGHSVTYFAIEYETSTDVWEVVGTAYDGENVTGVAEKNGTTGVVTLNCNFIPPAAGTYNLRARAVCDNDAVNYTVLSTNTARDGGIGSVVTITATVRPFVVGSDNYTLILVDKSGTELFTESNVPSSRVENPNDVSGRNGDPIDNSWRSPLVTRYYYYSVKADAQSNSGSNLFDWSSTAATPTVYVGYEVSDAIDLNSSSFSDLSDLMNTRVARSATEATRVRDADSFGKMYLLKFKTSAAYYSEDGSDKVETDATPAGTTVYPYTNGDGPMYIYTDSRYQDQKDNGASTRTRWPWFLVSPTGDPYHVYITSWQNSHARSGTNYYSYLRTFYQSGVGIVTNNVTDDPTTKDGSDNQILPTEYMLLRADDSNGTYKLKTVAAIDNGATTERRDVTSLEQYWRNNPTAQIQAGRSESNNGELTDAEKTTLRSKGWNNYNTYVNAAGWTGGTGSANKSYANSEHWYQSIQLGNGSFDLVEADINGVLVLLDNHGWEIMRQPIVAKDAPDYETVKTALKKYDSPMVKEYKFYSTRTVNHKVYGYHKYDIITNTGSKTPLAASTRVDADKTITSLADYEPHTSGGALTDLYVTYDVKDEYANSYVGAATEGATSASQFLVRQGSNYAKANGASIDAVAVASLPNPLTDALKWTLKPNFNIDAEMGYRYNNGTGNSEPSKEALETIYYNAGWNGFDPYNLRIQNVSTSTYFTTNADDAALSSGAWTGNGTTLSLTDATSTYEADGYDQTTLAVTNATFMAVQDGNGNMRLMPRFQHEKVVQGFTALAEQAADQPAGNTTHNQTTLLTTPITYHIVDNSGSDVFGALTYTGAGFAVPKEYQSPMVDTYYYHSSLADAQDNRTTSNVTTVSPNDVVYVSYKVSDDFNADKAYTIYGANSYMHACYRYGQAEDNTGNGVYLWWMRNQNNDRDNGNTISIATLPFLDNTYAWQVGETPDPYNVRFLNKGARRYMNQENTGNNGRMEQLVIIETAGVVPATATPFCILYYGDSSDDCTLYNRTQSKYVVENGSEWQANATRTGDNRRLTITELPAISINVVNAANEVECTLEGYYKSGCTWSNSFTPFYLQRIYTSGHTFYYTLADATAETNAISGTVNDATVTTNGAVYVKYTLASDWGAAVDDDDLTAKRTAQTIKVMPSPSSDKINWYAVRTSNGSHYIGASTTETPANLSQANATNATADATADASKLAQWALIGTPYNLKLVDRYHGMSNYLGISEDAANRSFAFIDDGTADITTWEVCTGYNSNAKLLIRPQRSLNGETPYLYIGWNGGANNMSLAMSTGGNQGLDLTWVKETDAKTLTFKLYDMNGTYMSPTVSDFTLTGVSAGDDLAAAFSHTNLKRRFCEYTFYTDDTFGTTTTEAGTSSAETVYVKWDYTDYAPVFSTGSETRDYQYYIMTVCASGSNYPYIIGVDDDGSGGYTFGIDQNIGSIREHKHQFALVGNPYSFKLYSRYADQYVGTPNQSGLQIGGGAEDAVFDMQVPISEMNIVQFVARLKGTVKTVTCNPPDVWIGGANSGFLTLRDIIIPVHVFKEGMTDYADQMDYREYAMDLTSHLSTADRITDSQLTETGNAVGTAHDFRHAFCDYTFYRSYDWNTGDMDNLIPDEGLPYYGGKDQWKRQFFATYTVDHDGFDQIYLIKGSDGEDIYIGKDTESTHGYTLKGVNNKTTAKNDDTRSYRWQMIGDPYDLQIVNVGLGETRNNFPLAVKAVSDGTTTESEDDGTLALLTSEIPEDDSDTESYGQYTRWEIIAKSDGNYVFWNIDEGEALRYTKSLGRHYAAGNGGVVRMLASEEEMVLELPIERYAVIWHVMENDGSDNYSQVATSSVTVDENTTVVLDDMPTSLKRHFCLYNNMYSNEACSDAYSGNSVTVSAETNVYVPYTLDSGAPDFLSATPTASTAEKYWYEIGYPEVGKYIYYDTTNGVSSQNAASVSALRDAANYQYCRWALVGSPYSVRFYNKTMGTYLTSDGEALTMGGEGTTFTLYDDYSGNLCAIYDAATGTYINASATLQTYNGAGGTAADFSNTFGVVKIAFVLHYSANTLRKCDSDDDNELDATAANTTETIRVDSYQKLGKDLDDVLPKAWKRAFCKYTYDWGTESTPSGTTVENVNDAMVTAYNSNMSEYLYVHVTYDYTDDSPFQWSTTTSDYTGKHWYYLVNNHRPNGILGKMVHRDSDPKLRISTDLVSDQLYLNNYEWCVIGDPYGFRMLNRYDPDHRFDEFISVTSDVDDSSGKYMFQQAASNSRHVFEMMPGQYSYNFWIHPVYSVTTMEEPTDGFDELSYMGQNNNGSAAILMTSTATALRTNSAANFRLVIRSDATLTEYLNYVGMVGALTPEAVASNSDLLGRLADGTATDADKTAIHDLADDPTNLVQMAQGYYRLIPYTWEKNNDDRRYVRGYHYENERTANSGMNRNMKVETLNKAEYDPASVLWFGETTDGGYPRYYVQTQDLGLTGNGMDTGDGYKCRYEDIGAGIMQLKSQSEANSRHYDYLSCAGGDETSINHCFDEQAGRYKTRFYLQPIGSDDNLLPLRIQLYPGLYTDETLGQQTFYFATLYVPYDVVLPDGDVYAYVGRIIKNDGEGSENDWRLQCEKMSAQTVGGTAYAKGKYIPAGTPVLIRAAAAEGALSDDDGLVSDYDYDHRNDNSYYVTLTIPNTAPATGLASVGSNILKGKYLEQVLTGTAGTDVPGTGESVYVFGQATNTDYTTIPDDPDRDGTQALEAGFYINKNTTDGSATYANRNNLYVRHNKVYLFEKTLEGDYPSSTHYGGASARQFIALDFGETGIEGQPSGNSRYAAEGVYDLLGRRVASGQEAMDGSWRKVVKSGVYIVNGRKVMVK